MALTFTSPQGVTKRCRLSWLTNSALVCEPKWGGRGGFAGSQPMSIGLYTGAQIIFGDLTPYLTYGGGAFREKIYIEESPSCRPLSLPETHTKRLATQHGCLSGLLVNGHKGIEKCTVRKKNICIGPTRPAKAEQKSILTAS